MNPQFIERLQAAILHAPSALIQLNESALTHRPAPNKWSKKEIFGHLIDSARVNLQRFLEAQHTENKYIIQRYHQDELVQLNDYQNQPIGELIQLWKTTNQQILRVFKNVKKEKLDLPIEIPHQEVSDNLRFVMEDYVVHMEHHLRQILGDSSFLEKKERREMSVEEAMQQLKKEDLFTTVLEHESMYVEIYQPDGEDHQMPHDQDELYVVISGSGDFYNNGITKSFQAGDVLFVPAGDEHRFLNFTDDFKTWVIFYGPKGGEASNQNFYEIKKEIAGEEFTISTDVNKIDTISAHDFLSNSYWGKGRTLATMEKIIDGSLVFGLFYENKQIGMARVVSDFVTTAYLADVYVLEKYRGKGLGEWLVDTIMSYEPLSGIRNFLLHTLDAHGLYERVGFRKTIVPERIMEKDIPLKF